MQAEGAVLHLKELSILHRDIKPSKFLARKLHRRVRLLLGDFDLACQEDEVEESSTPVGTAAFWSPRFDMNSPDWTYTRDDDWLGLGLTFGYWLGVYSGSPLPKAAAEQKLGVLSRMLGPAYKEHLPESFRDRFRPLYAVPIAYGGHDGGTHWSACCWAALKTYSDDMSLLVLSCGEPQQLAATVGCEGSLHRVGRGSMHDCNGEWLPASTD
jgi:hypothetical protein